MLKLAVGQEVRFVPKCWAKYQVGVVTEVFNTGFIDNGIETKYSYLVKITTSKTQTNFSYNFYDYELVVTKRDNRNLKIDYLLDS